MRQQLPATVQIRTNQDAFLFPATARKAVALSESRARSARLSCAPPGCGGKEAAGAELHRCRKLRNRELPRHSPRSRTIEQSDDAVTDQAVGFADVGALDG